jgi:RimJ/RimL family protein N-acetyltransferase
VTWQTPAEIPTEIPTRRLLLRPLRPQDADEMADVLSDERLHEFIGGRPLTLDELRDRYRRLAAGSPVEAQVWLNWIARRRTDDRPVGTVQATLTRAENTWIAEVAWVVGVDFQGQGFAAEAAEALVGWLRRCSVATVEAHIHPDHHASAAVATRAGLHPTTDQVEGEQVWRTPPSPSSGSE